MAKYYGLGGSRIGKVGQEIYEIRKGANLVRSKSNYVPVNNAWLKRDEFKKYVLELLDEGIPQIYVLGELPQELYPYALIFVQNQQGTSIYVDKEAVRTQINLAGGESDAVDITNAIPSNPRNNTIYFVNQPAAKNKNSTEYDIYVCDNNQLRQITIKGESDPDLPNIKEAVNNLTSKSLKNVYNTTLTANKNIITDSNGYLKTANIQHLYRHYINYARYGYGTVYFVIYNSSSSSLDTNGIFTYLSNTGCTDNSKLYPCSGWDPNTKPYIGMYAYAEISQGFLVPGFKLFVIHNQSTYEVNGNIYMDQMSDTVTTVF